jgi:hypothetical protein
VTPATTLAGVIFLSGFKGLLVRCNSFSQAQPLKGTPGANTAVLAAKRQLITPFHPKIVSWVQQSDSNCR